MYMYILYLHLSLSLYIYIYMYTYIHAYYIPIDMYNVCTRGGGRLLPPALEDGDLQEAKRMRVQL